MIFLLSLLGLTVTTLTLLFIFLEDIIDARIKDLLQKRFDGYYAMEFERIEKDIGFTEMTFIVEQAKFTSDTTNIEGIENYPIVFFETKELRIENVSTWDILWGNGIDLDVVELVEPDFSLYAKKRRPKKEKEKSEDKRPLSEVEIDVFNLVNGTLKIYDFESKKRLLINDSISIRLDDVSLHLNKMNQFADAFECSDFFVDSYRSELTPLTGFYEFGLDSLRLYGKEKKFDFKNIDIRTRESLKEISKKKINHSEVIAAFVEDVMVEGLDYDKLFYEDQLVIEKVNITGAKIDIFKNKLTFMESSFKKKVLNQIFNSIKFPLSVDIIQINDLDLTFELMASSIKKPAFITLDDVHGYLANFNTIPEQDDTLRVNVDAVLLKKGKLHLEVDMAIKDSIQNYQRFRGHLASLPFSTLNQTIQNFVNIKIIKGWIDRLDFAGYANDKRSWGTVAFRYHDLEMDIYSFKDKTEKRKNQFLTGVAKMAIYATNPLPNGGGLRTASFNYKRERWEGSVMLWLGGTLVGVLKTTLKDFVLDILKDQEEKKVKKALHEKNRKIRQEEKIKLKKARIKLKEEKKKNGKKKK